ncbi:hypothetical protein KI387_029897, partial [Taxus chinensis]
CSSDEAVKRPPDSASASTGNLNQRHIIQLGDETGLFRRREESVRGWTALGGRRERRRGMVERSKLRGLARREKVMGVQPGQKPLKGNEEEPEHCFSTEKKTPAH